MGRTAAAFPLVPRVHEEEFQPLHPRSQEGVRTRARHESAEESSDTLNPGITRSTGQGKRGHVPAVVFRHKPTTNLSKYQSFYFQDL